MNATSTIMYLSYGNGAHVAEIKFSLLTAFRFLPSRTPGYRYVIYTDSPHNFAGYDVEIRTLTQDNLTSWLGGGDYIHRRKTLAILDALERFPGNVAFVDADTYFRRSPAELFKRIGPGRTCLHVEEASVATAGDPSNETLKDGLIAGSFVDDSGRAIVFTNADAMWNSGVVGINSADRKRLAQAIPLMDQLWRSIRVFHVEQFATCHVLKATKISECRDIIFHYWPPFLKDKFDRALPAIISELEALPPTRRYERAYACRPRVALKYWAKGRAREAGRRLGFDVKGVLKSV